MLLFAHLACSPFWAFPYIVFLWYWLQTPITQLQFIEQLASLINWFFQVNKVIFYIMKVLTYWTLLWWLEFCYINPVRKFLLLALFWFLSYLCRPSVNWLIACLENKAFSTNTVSSLTKLIRSVSFGSLNDFCLIMNTCLFHLSWKKPR